MSKIILKYITIGNNISISIDISTENINYTINLINRSKQYFIENYYDKFLEFSNSIKNFEYSIMILQDANIKYNGCLTMSFNTKFDNTNYPREECDENPGLHIVLTENELLETANNFLKVLETMMK